MIYCSWTTHKQSRCDLYCYSDIDEAAWFINVAETKSAGDLSMIDWTAPRDELELALSEISREPIGLAYDGHTFTEKTIQAFKARLHDLRDLGYKFPQHVFDLIEDEIHHYV